MAWWKKVADDTSEGTGPGRTVGENQIPQGHDTGAHPGDMGAERRPDRRSFEAALSAEAHAETAGSGSTWTRDVANPVTYVSPTDVSGTPVEDRYALPSTAPAGDGSMNAAATPSAQNSTKDELYMADYQASLNEAMQIEGALGAALVESNTGMALATAGSPPGLDLSVAAAGNSSVVQAKLRTMKDLGLQEKLEDILITLQSQYHIIRPLGNEDGIFLYLVLDKERANLAMARFRLTKIEKALTI